MATEQLRETAQSEDEKMLLKLAITRQLTKIGNAMDTSLVGVDQLREWMSQHTVFETFQDAIHFFGRQGKLDYYFDRPGCLSEAIFDEIETGEDGEVTSHFQARLIKSADNTGPAVHIYARDTGHPDYAVFLPFLRNGTLDESRPISGIYFASDGLHSFSPQIPVIEKDAAVSNSSDGNLVHTNKDTAQVIAFVTCMSAAHLATYLEEIGPTKKEYPAAIWLGGPENIRCSRLANNIGRLSARSL